MNARHREPADPIDIVATCPEDTDRVGQRLSAALRPGDVVCLSGPLGAGKSHLARAVVRGCLGDPDAEVPSPTYTLVNVFASGRGPAGEIWHADLYRIDDAEELAEIGLDEAAGRAIVLVEWPERWPRPPARRLEIAIAVEGPGARRLQVRPRGPGWDRVLAALATVAP